MVALQAKRVAQQVKGAGGKKQVETVVMLWDDFVVAIRSLKSACLATNFVHAVVLAGNRPDVKRKASTKRRIKACKERLQGSASSPTPARAIFEIVCAVRPLGKEAISVISLPGVFGRQIQSQLTNIPEMLSLLAQQHPMFAENLSSLKNKSCDWLLYAGERTPGNHERVTAAGNVGCGMAHAMISMSAPRGVSSVALAIVRHLKAVSRGLGVGSHFVLIRQVLILARSSGFKPCFKCLSILDKRDRSGLPQGPLHRSLR